MTRLHRVQNSVWAGTLTLIEWKDLDRQLHENAGSSKVQAWIFRNPPDVRHYGGQADQESVFL